jgi:phosphatidylethanolamine-binding protein (PEBP) family uncharacterized protein
VEQRTGAKRFLALPAKSTSAGLCLALVPAVLLLLSGCGGGSSADTNTTASSATTAANDNPATAPASPGASGGQSGATPKTDKASAGGQAAAPKSASAPGAQGATEKHGPRIATPKGPREQAPTPAEVSELTVADMHLASPSLPAGAPLTATYTCDGEGKWPALSWGGVPTGTAELILYAMNAQPVGGKLFVDWAVAGLDPGLTGIEAAKLPKGAVVGTNSFGKRGYEICPEGSEIYIFAVYALPRALSPEPGFDARELRRAVLDVSGNVGLLSLTYSRS